MKHHRDRAHRLLLASAIVGSLAVHATAHAQANTPDAAQPPAAPSATIDNQVVTGNDIIVTATKRADRLENVPATIVAVTGKALESAGVTKFSDISLVAPGVQVARSGTYTQPSIRGISTSFAGGGQETNIAVFIDGIYQSDQLGTNQDLTNLQDIQILKGPQGTLYGRNATGGAILITTRSPTDKLQADGNVSYSWRYNEKIANLFVGGPIANGIKFSVAASYHDSDGYFKDVNHFSKNVILDNTTYTFGGHGSANFAKSAAPYRHGDNTAPFKNWSVRPKLVFEPTDNLKITLGYVHTYLDDRRGPSYNEVSNNTLNPAAGYDGLGNPCVPGAPGCNRVASKRNETSLVYPPANISKQDEFNGTVEWKLGDAGTITSRTAYRKQKDFEIYDLDGTPRDPGTPGVATAYASIQHNKRHTFIEQLDYNGQFGDLSLLAGFFYINDRFKAIGIEDTGTATNPSLSFTDFHTKAWAAYIDGTYKLGNLFLTAGVRYNHDQKDLSAIRYDKAGNLVPANITACFTGGLVSVVDPSCSSDQLKKISRNAWTPHVVARYNLSRGTNIYASWSRGFKAGTINTGTPFNALKPETVTAYEVGIKTARGGFRAEASAFYYNYKNNQISAFNGSTTVVSNSGGAHVYGLDLSLNYKVPDMPLNLRGSMEYLHARYTNFPEAGNITVSTLKDPAGHKDDPNTPADEFVAPTINPGTNLTGTNTAAIGSWTGRRLLRGPDWTASIGADYTMEGVFGGKLVASATAQYSSRYAPQNASYFCTYYTAVAANDPNLPMPINQKSGDVPGQNYCDPGQSHGKGRFEENGWAQLNAQLAWTDASDHFTVTLFGNNINNVHYKIVSSQTVYGKYEMYSEPRTFGVRVGAKF